DSGQGSPLASRSEDIVEAGWLRPGGRTGVGYGFALWLGQPVRHLQTWCREQGQWRRPGPGHLDEGGRAAVDVTGLPDVETAHQLGVGVPRSLLAGRALVTPRVPDDL